MKNTETLRYLIEKRLNSCGISFSVYILTLSIYNKQKNNAENSCAHSVLGCTIDKRRGDAAVFLT